MSYFNESLTYRFNLSKLNTESLTNDEIHLIIHLSFFDTLSFEFRDVLENCVFRGY